MLTLEDLANALTGLVASTSRGVCSEGYLFRRVCESLPGAIESAEELRAALVVCLSKQELYYREDYALASTDRTPWISIHPPRTEG